MSRFNNVLVTGGSGGLGRWVVADLLEHGYHVTNVDLRPSDRIHTFQADLTDLGQTFGMVEGKDAIIHLAAIPWPGEHPPEVVFRLNTMSTFNILQAACVLGVKKVVMAGSESALGFAYKFRPFLPSYLPIDEQHPLQSQDAYGLSKTILEELGRGFVRRAPDMSVISLRFSWIIPPDEFAANLPDVWANPERAGANLWGYVDARDAARACRLALEYPHPGFDAFFIRADDTLMREPTLDLVARYYPGVERIAPGFGGRMAVLNGRHAAETLGFEPEYTWATSVVPEELA